MKELTPEQWATIDQLFDAALDRPEDERTAFLRAKCGHDSALYQQVIALLESEPAAMNAVGDDAGLMFNEMLRDIQHEQEEAADVDLTSVGPYRIVETLGRGGMGTVYLAEGADGTFEKSVALKLVKRGMDTDEVLRRFRYERQILAGLDHPNIARLLDAGAADDGRPYFVLEYCNGDTITNYADANRLNIDQRLTLFEQVCEAVAYAHRHLVVHRDLKPGNIMVADGEPALTNGKDASGDSDTAKRAVVKLLDFGIAQLMEDRPDAPVTRADRRILTPEYAAPEQIRGEPVTTAADVYALGVVLHELLVGSRPAVPLKRPSTVVTAESVVETGLSVERLKRELKTDLDAIVIKALQEDPQLRYKSADALLEDLRRRREGLPLQARDSTVGYRTKKFVARHQWGVGAVAVALIALSAFVFALDQQRRQTVQERDTAEATAAFLKDLFNAADPFSVETARPDTLRAVDLLDRGVSRARATLADRPRLQANTLQTVGVVYAGLSLYESADSLLSDVVAKRRQLPNVSDIELSESLHELGVVRSRNGMLDSAEALFVEALELRKKAFGTTSIPYAQTLAELGSAQFKHGKYEEAKQSFSRALEIQEGHLGRKSLDVASTMTMIARLTVSQGRPADAEPIYREALEIRRSLLSDDHLIVAESLDNLGVALQEQRKLDEAEQMTREALRIRLTALGEHHTAVADTRHNLAVIVRAQGKNQESLDLLELVGQANIRNLGPDHPYVGYNLVATAVTQSRMGLNQEAMETYKAAHAQLTKTLPETHGAVIEAVSGQGYQYVRLGEPARGEPLLRKVFDLRTSVDGPTSWRTGVAQSTLGHALMDQGKYAEAERHLVEGLATIREAKGPQHAAIQRLIALYGKTGDTQKAADYQTQLDAL